jgi:hypothetical protein
MLDKHTGNPLKTVFLLTLLGVFLVTNSCGHAKASPSPVATSAVMKTIQNYGRDHHGLLSLGSSAQPDEPDGLYSARIKNLLVQEDFAQLEKIARQDRIEKGRLLGGVWKTYAFYNGTGMPVSAGTPTDSDYAAQIARVKKWIAASDSTTPRISLAYLYLNYGGWHEVRVLPTAYLNLNGVYSRVAALKRKRYFSRPAPLRKKTPSGTRLCSWWLTTKAGTRPTSASYSIKPSLLNRSTTTTIASMLGTFRPSVRASVAISWLLPRKRRVGFRN